VGVQNCRSGRLAAGYSTQVHLAGCEGARAVGGVWIQLVQQPPVAALNGIMSCVLRHLQSDRTFIVKLAASSQLHGTACTVSWLMLLQASSRTQSSYQESCDQHVSCRYASGTTSTRLESSWLVTCRWMGRLACSFQSETAAKCRSYSCCHLSVSTVSMYHSSAPPQTLRGATRRPGCGRSPPSAPPAAPPPAPWPASPPPPRDPPAGGPLLYR
jgi:hypothetical protein